MEPARDAANIRADDQRQRAAQCEQCSTLRAARALTPAAFISECERMVTIQMTVVAFWVFVIADALIVVSAFILYFLGRHALGLTKQAIVIALESTFDLDRILKRLRDKETTTVEAFAILRERELPIREI